MHARTHARTSPQALKRKLSAARDDFVKEVEVCCDLRHEHLVRTRRRAHAAAWVAAAGWPPLHCPAAEKSHARAAAAGRATGALPGLRDVAGGGDAHGAAAAVSFLAARFD
eukprot:SAG25_NODE_3301_length_1139_cov_0.750000_1_plen_111_part_00